MSFTRPHGAENYLLQPHAAADLHRWAASWLPDISASNSCLIVETDKTLKEGNGDPYPVLKRLIPRNGMLSQFIDTNSHPDLHRSASTQNQPVDYPARAVIVEAAAHAGVLARPFPALAPVDPGTLVVAFHAKGHQQNRRKTGKHVVVGVCVELETSGSPVAWGYAPHTGWRPLPEAVAALYASEELPNTTEVSRIVTTAVAQLTAARGTRPTIVVLPATMRSQILPALADTSTGTFPPALQQTTVVRWRSTDQDEIPRPTGNYTGFRALNISESTAALTYLESGSATMSRERDLRGTQTRFSFAEENRHRLGRNWQSNGVTEFTVVNAASIDAANSALDQVLMMCRSYGFNDRTLRLPGPAHLAKKTVEDHPAGYSPDD